MGTRCECQHLYLNCMKRLVVFSSFTGLFPRSPNYPCRLGRRMRLMLWAGDRVPDTYSRRKEREREGVSWLAFWARSTIKDYIESENKLQSLSRLSIPQVIIPHFSNHNSKFKKYINKEWTKAIIKKQLIWYKCIIANTSVMWQHAAHTTDQLTSPNC